MKNPQLRYWSAEKKIFLYSNVLRKGKVIIRCKIEILFFNKEPK